MTYKAKIDFTGVLSMNAGETADIADESIAKDLLKAGYIEEVKAEKKKPRTRAKKG